MADDSAGEKTEDATQRKREEAREKGQVAFSTEFIAALALFAALLMYKFASLPVFELLGGGVRMGITSIAHAGTKELDVVALKGLLTRSAEAAMFAILIFAGPLVLFTAVVAFAQVGVHFSPGAVEIDPTKLNPAKGLQRMFSIKSAVKVGMAILKIIFIASAILTVAWNDLGKLSVISGTDLGPVMLIINGMLMRSIIAALLAVLFLGVIDLVYQRWQHNKDLKMSKQEVKEESKAQNGDPHIKARIRDVQREMASQRMMDSIPDATVVVTNPTHYAVALKYDRESPDGGAPRIVAKGVDQVAQNIKKVARDNGVVCFENVPLARALHAQCEIGDIIPEELFDAVANVLAYVYRIEDGKVAV